jgi:hypothetical protein
VTGEKRPTNTKEARAKLRALTRWSRKRGQHLFVDWLSIEQVYVHGVWQEGQEHAPDAKGFPKPRVYHSIETLAEVYTVHHSTLRRRAKEGNWDEKRADAIRQREEDYRNARAAMEQERLSARIERDRLLLDEMEDKQMAARTHLFALGAQAVERMSPKLSLGHDPSPATIKTMMEAGQRAAILMGTALGGLPGANPTASGPQVFGLGVQVENPSLPGGAPGGGAKLSFWASLRESRSIASEIPESESPLAVKVINP